MYHVLEAIVFSLCHTNLYVLLLLLLPAGPTQQHPHNQRVESWQVGKQRRQVRVFCAR